MDEVVNLQTLMIVLPQFYTIRLRSADSKTYNAQRFQFFFSGQLEMWANAQRDGRPAENRWRPLLNDAKFG